MPDSKKNLRSVGSLVWFPISNESRYPALVLQVNGPVVTLGCFSVGRDSATVHCTDEEFSERYEECTLEQLFKYRQNIVSMFSEQISAARNALNHEEESAKAFSENYSRMLALRNELNTMKG
jgi:hypothetical protein